MKQTLVVKLNKKDGRYHDRHVPIPGWLFLNGARPWNSHPGRLGPRVHAAQRAARDRGSFLVLARAWACSRLSGEAVKTEKSARALRRAQHKTKEKRKGYI